MIVKLEKELEEYRSIWRGRTQRRASQIQMEEKFQASLGYLFDITHVKALQLIKIAEDREFLIVAIVSYRSLS